MHVKKFLITLVLILCSFIVLAVSPYGTKNYMESGGQKWVVGGTLDIVSGGVFKVGSSTVTATADEINKNDISAETSTIASGTISASKRITQIATTTSASVTLAAPDASMVGSVKIIQMTTDGGDATLACTNIVGQSTGSSITFNDAGDAVILMGGASGKWIVLKEYGVTLS